MKPLRVLVVPDKLKGTLTAVQAADALCRGWRAVRPSDELDVLPMADGGDGFGTVFGALLGASEQHCMTSDAAGRPRQVSWWQAAQQRCAVFETAQVNGWVLFEAQSHPFALDTYGLGAVLAAMEHAGVQTAYLGLGGSATNDGGFGVAKALGWSFRDGSGRVIERWTQLDQLVSIESPTAPRFGFDLILAVDVVNPLLGPRGATFTYGPQKGLGAAELVHAEACLERLARVVETQFASNAAREPGAGAAGGLGFGLRVFAAGRLTSGAQLFVTLSGLHERIAKADLVLTAEGAFDAQSGLGKGVGVVVHLASDAGKPCICIAGSVSSDAPAWPGLRSYAIVPDCAPLAQAQAAAAHYVERLARRAASDVG